MGCRLYRRLEGLQWFGQPTFARTGLAAGLRRNRPSPHDSVAGLQHRGFTTEEPRARVLVVSGSGC